MLGGREVRIIPSSSSRRGKESKRVGSTTNYCLRDETDNCKAITGYELCMSNSAYISLLNCRHRKRPMSSLSLSLSFPLSNHSAVVEKFALTQTDWSTITRKASQICWTNKLNLSLEPPNTNANSLELAWSEFDLVLRISGRCQTNA